MLNAAGHRRGPVAQLCAHDGSVRRWPGREPVEFAHPQLAALQRLSRAHHHLPRARTDFDHVHPAVEATAQSAALAHGEGSVALVAAHDPPTGVQQVAGPERVVALAEPAPQQVAVVTGGHEANLLRLGLGRGDEVEFAGAGAHLGLGEFAQREPQARQQRAGQAPQEVGLVLGRVASPEESRLAVHDPGPHVVPGSHGIAPEQRPPSQKIPELGVGIAPDAGVGCATARVLRDEIVDDVAGELLLHVEDVVGDAQRVGDPARVHDAVEPAAGARRSRLLLVAEGFHGRADELVALLGQQRGRHRGVDPSGHGHQDPLGGHPQPPPAPASARARFTISMVRRAASLTSAEVVVRPRLKRTEARPSAPSP